MAERKGGCRGVRQRPSTLTPQALSDATSVSISVKWSCNRAFPIKAAQSTKARGTLKSVQCGKRLPGWADLGRSAGRVGGILQVTQEGMSRDSGC